MGDIEPDGLQKDSLQKDSLQKDGLQKGDFQKDDFKKSDVETGKSPGDRQTHHLRNNDLKNCDSKVDETITSDITTGKITEGESEGESEGEGEWETCFGKFPNEFSNPLPEPFLTTVNLPETSSKTVPGTSSPSSPQPPVSSPKPRSTGFVPIDPQQLQQAKPRLDQRPNQNFERRETRDLDIAKNTPKPTLQDTTQHPIQRLTKHATQSQKNLTDLTNPTNLKTNLKRDRSNTPPFVAPLPAASSPTPESPALESPALKSPNPSPPWTWRNAERATQWQRLKPLDAGHLRRYELIAAVCLFGLVAIGIHSAIFAINWLLLTLNLRPVQAFFLTHYRAIALGLVSIWAIAPFLLDQLLQRKYGAKPLLKSRFQQLCPEAAQVVQSFSRQRQRQLPTLWLLATETPIVLTYGYHGQAVRLVISEGAIAQFTPDEFATLIAGTLAAIAHRDLFFATGITALLQLVYGLYELAANVGDRAQAWRIKGWQVSTAPDRAINPTIKQAINPGAARSPAQQLKAHLSGLLEKLPPPVVQQFFNLTGLGVAGICAIGAALSYGSFWLLRLPVLPWSRLRQVYADRLSANLTGNPNARIRALVKLTQSYADSVRREGEKSHLLERLQFLAPIDVNYGIWLGSTIATRSPLPWLTWDLASPYTRWLSLLQTHPLLGDRCRHLSELAERWSLSPELIWEEATGGESPSPSRSPSNRLNRSTASRPRSQPLPLSLSGLLQSPALNQNFAPVLYIAVGLGVIALSWIAGVVGRWALIPWLSWLQADWFWLAQSAVWIGWAIGTILRINSFFPDFKPYALKAEPDLDQWAIEVRSLPIDSRTLRLRGILRGRRGMANWCAQDLWLDDGQTLWALHYFDRRGGLGWFLPATRRPASLIGQTVEITGWFRRGSVPWIDVDAIEVRSATAAHTSHTSQTSPQQIAGHPLWSTALAIGAVLMGLYIIIQGGA